MSGTEFALMMIPPPAMFDSSIWIPRSSVSKRTGK